MDSSTLFKACVKTVALRNKNLEIDGGSVGPNPQQKRPKRKTAFFTKAQAVVGQISRLRQFLLENRPAYLNFSNYLSTKPNMTDADRDQIDIGAQKIIASCNQLIKELRREIAEADVSQQNLEHQETMLLLIEDYLKRVCNINSEQKAIRVKRAVEMRKMAKLEADPKVKSGKQMLNKVGEENHSSERSGSSERKKGDGGLSVESSPMKIQELNGDVTSVDQEELSAEDIQIFELENEQLFSELNTLTEEVKQIESKVVHIAELQEIFTEKVLDQDRDLDRLMTTVVGSTENVKAANEQIRQAIQQNAGLRVWILFFLIVMSFSLLFLDWYNP